MQNIAIKTNIFRVIITILDIVYAFLIFGLFATPIFAKTHINLYDLLRTNSETEIMFSPTITNSVYAIIFIALVNIPFMVLVGYHYINELQCRNVNCPFLYCRVEIFFHLITLIIGIILTCCIDNMLLFSPSWCPILLIVLSVLFMIIHIIEIISSYSKT